MPGWSLVSWAMGNRAGDGSITLWNLVEQDWRWSITLRTMGSRTGDGSITPENRGEQDWSWVHHP